MKTIKLLDNGEPAGARSRTRPSQSKQTSLAAALSRDEVARQAYFLYLQEGSPQGRDVQHWLEAERRTQSP